MKRIILGAVAGLLLVGTVSASAQTDEERQELRRRLQELRQEVRDLERQLGENRYELRTAIEPLVLAMAGNRARLGVVVNTAEDSEGNAIGAELQAVTPDGPADEAGLEAGDVIISVNGESLTDTRRSQTPGDKLVEWARELEEGDTVRVEYQREGQRRTATIVARRVPGYAYSWSFQEPNVEVMAPRIRVETREMADRARELAEQFEGERFLQGAPWVMRMTARWADMELTTLDEDLGRYFGTTEGLLVVRAPKEDALLNLRSGDVILRIGGRVPSSPSHAIRILRSYEPGDEIRMDIMRDKQRQTITATVPEREHDRGLFWQEN